MSAFELNKKFKTIAPVRLFVSSFLLVIIIGTVLLMLPISARSGQPTSFVDSLFTTVSATCVTGLVAFDTWTHWNDFGQAVILLLIRALTYAQQMQSAITTIDERVPFMDQIADALERYRAHPQQDGTEELNEVTSLGLAHVSFGYEPGVDVLHDVSFDLLRGQAIGIVGPSGAGKSSIVQVLLRLRDPHSGAVLVNGRDARGVRRSNWQRLVAYVPQ